MRHVIVSTILLFTFGLSSNTYAYTLQWELPVTPCRLVSVSVKKTKYIVWIVWVALHLFRSLIYFVLNLACSALAKPMSMINVRGKLQKLFFSTGSSSFIQVQAERGDTSITFCQSMTSFKIWAGMTMSPVSTWQFYFNFSALL